MILMNTIILEQLFEQIYRKYILLLQLILEQILNAKKVIKLHKYYSYYIYSIYILQLVKSTQFILRYNQFKSKQLNNQFINMFINTIQYILYNIQIQIIPSIMSQQQTKQNKESIKEEIKAEKKPVVQYRIEPLRVIQILNQHSDKKKRAKVLATLRSSLFGKKRYQNIYVNCSLNNLFNALRITHFLNNKVPNLAMIIRFSPFKIIEMHSNNQASVIQRKKIEIKLTYLPSTQDKNEPGYNPGKPVQQIIDPITDMPQYRNRQKKYTQKPRRQQRNQQNNEGFKYRQAKHERLEEQEQNPREQKRYQNYQHKNRQNKQSHQVRQSKHQRLQDQQADRSYQRTEVRKTRGGHKQNNERHNEPKQLKDHTYRSEHLNKQ